MDLTAKARKRVETAMSEPWNVVSLLQQLIRLPSVNPMGREVEGPPYLEHRVTDFLQDCFERLGLPWYRQSTAPGRDNIVALWEGESGGNVALPLLVWEVHQDTVPVDGMIIDPWEPVIRDGRLYGRGACDVKGAMACMLSALSRLVRERLPGRASVVLACSVNEESGFSGARDLARSWAAGNAPLITRRPQGLIVAEPTSLRVVVAHKGVVRWRCHTRGRAAHSSAPQHGENAIYRMAHVVRQLQQYAESLRDQPADPLLGCPTINVGTIQGGICVNAVPDRCTIELDRRVLPHEEPEQARQAVIDWLHAHLDLEVQNAVQHEPPYLISGGLPDQSSTDLARQLVAIARQLEPAAELVGVPYGTDAPCFSPLGIPTVVFGPGSIAQAHTADEWIALQQLEMGVEAYYRSATAMVW